MYFRLLASLACGLLIGYLLGRCSSDRIIPRDNEILRDTIICRDTIRVVRAVEIERRILRVDTLRISLDTTGGYAKSDAVAVPIEQIHYSDSSYEAWVSGYHPALDSLRIFREVPTVTITHAPAPRRWHLGISAGVAVTPHGIEPAVGIGITYSFKSF